jgi:hypothetical protein
MKTIQEALDVSEEDLNLILTTFLSKKLYTEIMPRLAQSETSNMVVLYEEFNNSIVNELEKVYAKFCIEVTENTRKSWVQLLDRIHN